jgi:hypothetical protein
VTRDVQNFVVRKTHHIMLSQAHFYAAITRAA